MRVFCIHSWISVIYAMVMWSLLCPVIDCSLLLFDTICLYSDFSLSFMFSGVTQLCYLHWYVPCCHATRLVTTQFWCCTNTEVWQMWIIMCWPSFRCTIAFLNLATNTLDIVIVQQIRKIVPRPEVVPLIIPITRNDSMILSCVIWKLLSLLGCCNGFKGLQDE